MELETERLFIKLLTLSQLKLWVNDISMLEIELNCKCDKGPIDGFLLNIINNQIKIIENDPENYVYHSFWFIIRKADKRAVGTIDYKNIPNERKEVEIGYGLEKQFEHNGYMTEAVGAFCKMAFMDKKIETIIAETEVENIASSKVLERCGFKEYKEERTHWWRLNKNMNKYINVNRIEFVVTNKCSGKCKHCSAKLSSKKESINAEIAIKVINDLCKNYSINSIMTFGGEPLLYAGTVCQIQKTAYENNVKNRELITNGYFSKNIDKIKDTAKKLYESNITKILLSIDTFHQESIPLEPVIQFGKALLEYGFNELKTHPAWVIDKEHDNMYNKKTKELLNTFVEMGIEPSNGNNIIPEGNALKYLREYFKKPTIEEIFLPCGSMPYTETLNEINTINVNPNGDIKKCSFLLGNVYEENILEIIKKYNPYENMYSKMLIEGGVKKLYDFILNQGIEIDIEECYSPCMLCKKIIHH